MKSRLSQHIQAAQCTHGVKWKLLGTLGSTQSVSPGVEMLRPVAQSSPTLSRSLPEQLLPALWCQLTVVKVGVDATTGNTRGVTHAGLEPRHISEALAVYTLDRFHFNQATVQHFSLRRNHLDGDSGTLSPYESFTLKLHIF